MKRNIFINPPAPPAWLWVLVFGTIALVVADGFWSVGDLIWGTL